MGFLDALSKVLGHHKDDHTAGAAYDRSQWRKKLVRVLDQLPDSQNDWEPLQADARALSFDPAWVKACEREEFALLMRRAVSDGVVTGMEHRKLDLARDLIGIPEDEAESILNTIVAEAQAFFGKDIRGA